MQCNNCSFETQAFQYYMEHLYECASLTRERAEKRAELNAAYEKAEKDKDNGQ